MSEGNPIVFKVDDFPGWAAGHFPGDPLMPGARLLDAVIRQLQAARIIAAGACSVAQAKFSAPVRPGNTISLAWTISAKRLRFECSVAGTVVASGQIATEIA